MPNVHEKRVLIVDDNKSIRTTVVDFLRSKGYDVIEASDGIQGLDKGLSTAPSLIILDVVMPGIDGFKLCQLFREKGVTTPIIMLTEKATIEDKVTGFSFGADDYLAKPFSPLELELRIQALLRRTTGEAPPPPETKILKHGDLEIDLDRHTVRAGDRDISLTPIEFNILKLLASNPGYVYSRNRLRTKLEENPKQPKYILTVWGIGYKFNENL